MPEVVVAGAAGRMGSRVVACLADERRLHLAAALEAPNHPALGHDAGEVAGIARLGVAIGSDPGAALTSGRILVEFSEPAATLEHLRLIAAVGGRAVIGTTGFRPEQRKEIVRLAETCPILLSPNMSVAVNVAFTVLAIRV